MRTNEADAALDEAAPEPGFKGTRTRVPFAQVRIVRKSAGRLFRNHRLTFCPESVEELAEDIRVHGLLEPIIVREGEDGWYDLVAGERRLRAIQSLVDSGARCVDLGRGVRGPAAQVYEQVDVLLVECSSDLEMLEISLAENLHTHPVSDFDLMVFCSELCSEHERKVVCKLLGKSASYLSTMLDLAEYPQEVLEMFRDGTLTRRACINLLKVKPDRLLEAIRLGGDVTRREAAKEAAAAVADLQRLEGKPTREDEDLAAAGPSLLGRVAAEAAKRRTGPGHREKTEEQPEQPPEPVRNRSKKLKAARKRLEAAEERGMSGTVTGEGISRVLQDRPDLLREDRVPQAWTPKRTGEAAEQLEAAVQASNGGPVLDPLTGRTFPNRDAQIALRVFRQVLGRGGASAFEALALPGEGKEAA